MNFNSKHYAQIIDHAVAVRQDLAEQLEEILGTESVTEDDAVVFFSSLAVFCRMSAFFSRALSGLSAEEIKKLLKEDCVRTKIIMSEIYSKSLPALAQETGTDEIAKFLEEVEFFEYPDDKVAGWGLDIDLNLDVAQ